MRGVLRPKPSRHKCSRERIWKGRRRKVCLLTICPSPLGCIINRAIPVIPQHATIRASAASSNAVLQLVSQRVCCGRAIQDDAFHWAWPSPFLACQLGSFEIGGLICGNPRRIAGLRLEAVGIPCSSCPPSEKKKTPQRRLRRSLLACSAQPSRLTRIVFVPFVLRHNDAAAAATTNSPKKMMMASYINTRHKHPSARGKRGRLSSASDPLDAPRRLCQAGEIRLRRPPQADTRACCLASLPGINGTDPL